MLRTIIYLFMTLTMSIGPHAGAQTTWPDLSDPPSAENTGANDAALIIGIEDYLLVDDVPGAVANADDWYRYLKRTRGLPLGSAVVLRNHEATRESVLSEARDAASRVRNGGTLWLVFIGHGAPSKDGQDGLLLGADVQQTAESVYARGVSQDELLDALQGDQADTILVLDTCFSGKSTGGSALVSGLQPLVPNYAVQRPSALLLSAGRGDQFAGPLPGAARPAFSYLLLGALHGWGDLDGNGDVTATEAVTYAQGALVETVRDRRQTPQVHGDGDAVLSRGRAVGPDLLEIVLGETETAVGGATQPIGNAVETATSPNGNRPPHREQQPKIALEALSASEQMNYWEESARLEWLALATLLDSPDAESVEALNTFVSKYGDVTVGEEDWSMPMELGQADEARMWMGRHARRLASDGPGGAVIDPHWYEMVAIEPGEFWMGSPEDEEGRDVGEIQHRVQLTQRFAIGATEVTQELYEQVTGENPSQWNSSFFEEYGKFGSNRPVEHVSWYDAVVFCNRLSELEGLDPAYHIKGKSVEWDQGANGYRLPTEAEWEYAARGGQEYVYAGSNAIDDVAWYQDNSPSYAQSVGTKNPNQWGLYDMSGNLWEWVWDWSGRYPSGTVVDPTGPSRGRYRVARGGGYNHYASSARVALRALDSLPNDKGIGSHKGFRIARSIH